MLDDAWEWQSALVLSSLPHLCRPSHREEMSAALLVAEYLLVSVRVLL